MPLLVSSNNIKTLLKEILLLKEKLMDYLTFKINKAIFL